MCLKLRVRLFVFHFSTFLSCPSLDFQLWKSHVCPPLSAAYSTEGFRGETTNLKCRLFSDFLSKKAAEISLGIYKDGCIAILMHKLTHEVEPMMVVYACIGKYTLCYKIKAAHKCRCFCFIQNVFFFPLFGLKKKTRKQSKTI